jgi:CRISPR-associated endonuclease Cas2
MNPRKQQKPLGNVERGSLSRELLRLIHTILESEQDRKDVSAQSVIEYYNPQDRFERNRVWKAIKYLEEQNRINMRRVDDRYFLEVTEEGELKIEEEEVWELTIRKPKKWDGKWRIVMFDVPMSLSKNRVLFKQKLQQLGFIQYQMSVFVYPFDCREEVEHVATWCGILNYVKFIVADDLSDSEILARHFNVRTQQQ